MKDVAVIILNYKTWEDTLNEVELCHDFLNVSYEDIIVIDNNSPNDSSENLSKASVNKFIFISSEKNAGYAAGNNIGLRYAFNKGYKYGLVLNNDIEFLDATFLEKLVYVMEKDEGIAIVNSDIMSPDGYIFNRDAVKPSFVDMTFGAFFFKKKGRKINDMGGFGYVYRPQGCCMLTDLKKLNEVDFMDERTFLYFEELILAERLEKKGYKCACCTTTSVIHNHSKTVKSSLDQKRIRRINNESFSYYLKEYRAFSDVQIRICCLFNDLKMRMIN